MIAMSCQTLCSKNGNIDFIMTWRLILREFNWGTKAPQSPVILKRRSYLVVGLNGIFIVVIDWSRLPQVIIKLKITHKFGWQYKQDEGGREKIGQIITVVLWYWFIKEINWSVYNWLGAEKLI